MSSRRAKAASAREEKLRQLRELRESGRTGLQAYEAKEDTDIFELVTEEEFKARARRNVLEDDFVVDDNGEGYADGGLEDWDNPHTDADSSDADGSGSGGSDEEGGKRKDRAKRSKGSKHGKRKRDKKAAAEAAPAGGSLIDMFNKKAQAPRAARPDAAATSGAAANTDLLASIFDDLDQDAERQAEKRRRVARMQPRAEPSQPLVSPPVLGRRRSTVFDTDEPLAPGSSSPVRASPSRTATAASGFTRKLVKSEFSDGAEALESEPLESEPLVAVKDEDVADANMADADIPPVLPPAMDLAMPEIKVRKLQTPSAKKVKSAASFLPKFEKESAAASTGSGTKGMSAAQAAEAAGCTNWKDVKGAVTLQSSQGESGSSISESSASAQSMCAEDGSLNLYWFDCIEKGDIVYLFGKAFHPVLDRFVSCCVAVKNIQRNLFVLPRATKLDDSGSPTDQPVDMADVYNEFDEIRRKYRITEFASRPVTRKYAFELPNIPSESDYLKVVYPFSQPELPADLKGRTFSHVFGTKTRALELLILKRKLMGPCWLKIENAQISSAVVSWCKFDVTVNDPKSIKVFADSDPAAPKQAPPFVVMSLSLRTVMNHQKQVNEIVAVSALVYSNVSIEGPTKDMTASRFTAIRQLSDIPIPVGFNDLASRQETRPAVHSNERSLLSFLLAVVQRHDPDALVGHNIVDFDLDVLLHRMKSNNVSHWSRIGRLRRTVWPKMQAGAGGTGDSSYAEKQIVAGRLMCDTYRSAQDLIQSKNYSLTTLAASQLKIARPDIDFDKIRGYFWDASKLIEMINHCEFDTYLTFQLLLKLQVLPLTKQLTNLAGNIWARSLTGARAERNEYLLLHEFHNKKYIVPDKTFVNTPIADQNDENADDNAGPAKKGGRRKAAYVGGLVLEPKRGFYDKYVLLLDFNSLYPSIIQEYNICFTTVARTYDDEGDHMPTPPDPAVERGVLPRILGTLVERRRMVKSLMKSPTASPEELAQYDIRQKALKLTANSMYGCLGFAFSRFFAKPLAMLITAKGREILQSTVDLAQKSGLDVIYGDTDSIMIYTNTTKLDEVKAIGHELKKAVNKQYRLLEIEMDGFFQRMLLLKKKKYAAMVAEEKKDGSIVTHLETKGLDLVRRDWCGLSVDASNFVLKQIFSGEDRDDVVERIHQYLSKLGDDARAGQIPMHKFVINKSLTKNPEDYADKNSQPHVQVALQLKARGLSAKIGDTIPYVICIGAAGPIAERARHPDDLTREGSTEKIDIEWYLSNQIHPPVMRLCQPIEGTDSARLANCLGLDASKFRADTAAAGDADSRQGGDVHTLESQISDEERFKDVERWRPRCLHCGESHEFAGLVRIESGGAASGFTCRNAACGLEMPAASLAVQLRAALSGHVRAYLGQGVVCDDPACRTATRTISVYGRRCLAPGCRGAVSLQYSDRALNTQMQYYEALLDPARAAKRIDDLAAGDAAAADAARALLARTAPDARRLARVVDQYLATSARRWVDLGQLFSFALRL